MALRIPLTSADADYEQTTDLGGVLYRLRFTWNGRDAAWYVTISTQGGTAIVEGRRLRVDWPAFKQFTDERLPLGDLIPLDADGTAAEPGREDLGTRVPLLFG